MFSSMFSSLWFISFNKLILCNVRHMYTIWIWTLKHFSFLFRFCKPRFPFTITILQLVQSFHSIYINIGQHSQKPDSNSMKIYRNRSNILLILFLYIHTYTRLLFSTFTKHLRVCAHTHRVSCILIVVDYFNFLYKITHTAGKENHHI